MSGRTLVDNLRYDGKRVVVTGAARGIGAATVEVLLDLGAEVIAMDIAETDVGSRYIHVDLTDRKSIDAAFRHIEGPVHGLFNSAGVGSTASFREALLCNFVGTRHLTELIEPLMPSGSAVVTVSTTGSHDWRDYVHQFGSLVETSGFAAGEAWIDENADRLDRGYSASKRAIMLYTVLKANEWAARGVRINTTSPHATVTPMWQKFVDGVDEQYRQIAYSLEGRTCRPEVQAYAMAFLNSDAASFITGIDLPVDGGWLTKFAPGNENLLKNIGDPLKAVRPGSG
ncbi:SDR family oxidoreductase [Streptomyces sp. NPDC051985]|uniref:SDR family oxidoreductase n=1 Tax=Streptomyces sp. NPDC051985 TaxID=3155807 RepID=UPI00341E25C8